MIASAAASGQISDGMPDVTHDGLVVRGIGKTFNRNTVLDGIDLDVRPGSVVALLGENGAGKSTLSSIIAGALEPDAGGRMFWRGEPYAPQSPRDALASGIGLIHQETRLLRDLSIAENVFVGRLPMRHGKIDRAEMSRRAEEQLHRLGLDVSASRLVRTLRVAAQQQVEIAKALTLDARLLILDEPTAALGGAETDRLFEQIAKLRAQGVSFIYISHRLEEIERIADRIVVLRDGRLIASHDNGSVPVKTLIEQMVGRNVERIFPHFAAPRERTVLDVRSLTSQQAAFRDVSFSVRAGEVFGIAGIVGAGRTELVRAIAGADPVSSGSVLVEGEALHLRSPAQAIRAGVVLVPEDRKEQGVVLEHSIEDNFAYGSLDRLGARGWVQPQQVREFANGLIARLGVKGRPQQRAGSLSGGNQQKVVLAKWLAREPKVVILDEPTRGIDVGARAAIYEVIAKLAASGVAVVVVSSDLDEVLGLSHRVMVLARGRCKGVLPREEASDVRVMELATA
ncbi:sugar ABC transporter ATP-binding protein [Paraburkholderia sp. SUR17]|uniref:sugar ABC transporter ATP-binding protein n=1 Tax=Paraburkholderia sp. SUR17 TaxID=3034358 RepID=UPI002407D1AE|nr:sugar ABC transporter ATP-binding protein [Paraburkholderia sp. SUR17]WEY42750.1 sugar ABC transporter ATP-binding protein [Paraburkholderia sp. SUR17]